MSVHHVCAVRIEARRDIGSSGTGITDCSSVLCGDWKLKLVPLEEQVLLTTELSVSPDLNVSFTV